MKILVTGDWHIRASNPRYRVDNYYETLMGKIKWILDLAEKEECSHILQPGDFFDSPDQSNKVEIELMELLGSYPIDFIYTIFGQHDTKWRNVGNTALQKFYVSEFVKLPLNGFLSDDNSTYIYGASWEEEIPEPLNPEAINILITHRMVVQDKPLWDQQKDYITAKSLLLKYDTYDLIITGDNHQSFMETTTTEKKRGSVLLNCGSLMRTTIAQRDHKPCVWIYDTSLSSYKQHYIPIEPIEEVMNLELADETKERNEGLDAFMKGLSSNYGIELKFEDNLKNVIAENEIPNNIKNIADGYIARYYEGRNL